MKVSIGDYSYPPIKSLVIHSRKRLVFTIVDDGFLLLLLSPHFVNLWYWRQTFHSIAFDYDF